MATAKLKSSNTVLQEAVSRVKWPLVAVFVFSFFMAISMLAVPLYMFNIFDRVIGQNSFESLVVITFIVVIMLAVMAFLEWVRNKVLIGIGTELDFALAHRVFRAVFDAQRSSPDVNTTQALGDLYIIRNFVGGRALTPFFDAPFAPLFLIIVFIIHPALGMIALGGLVLMITLGIIEERVSEKPIADGDSEQRKGSQLVERSLINLDVLASMGMLNSLRQRWLKIHDKASALQSKGNDREGLLTAISHSLRFYMQIAILGAGAYLALQQTISPGAMIVSNILVMRSVGPFDQMISSWKQVVQARFAYQRLNQVLTNFPPSSEIFQLPDPVGNLSFEAVSYSPPRSKSLIVKNVSFDLKPGEALGIVGPSGAGKSTIGRLAVGVAPARSGTVRLDGSEIRLWDHDRLGPYIGYMPQSIELFAGTVAENISRFDQTGDDSHVVTAAKRARVHELIQRLPNGYNTDIGEFGMLLSGGQRQRIALARAIYRGPKIVVLDEPNSNLDLEGMAALNETIAEMKTLKTTVIIIAHSPQVLRFANRIMMMRGGVVEGLGPRDEMLKTMMPKAKTAPVKALPTAANSEDSSNDAQVANAKLGQA